jgi:hypothetical protein
VSGVPVGQLRAVIGLLWPSEITPAARRRLESLCTQHTEAPHCDWCGRAVFRDGTGWLAVKGVERGYDPAICEANSEDGTHEPAA